MVLNKNIQHRKLENRMLKIVRSMTVEVVVWVIVLDNKNECNVLNSSPNININYDFFINDGAVIIEDRDLSLDISYEIKKTEPSDQNIIKELLGESQVTSDVQCAIQTEDSIIKSNVQTENESASTSSTLLDKVPPVFKKCPFWPKENTSSVKKRKMKDQNTFRYYLRTWIEIFTR